MSLHIIGDIHGQAESLRQLLARLGWRVRNGSWRHPSARAIFVGDFIDRGPEQLQSVDIVRRMVDAGSAQAVMGNHEFNAIGWMTPDPDRPGEYLRPRNGEKGRRNREQHQAFLDAVHGRLALHHELLDWFRTLPLWLELPGIRVVHACWHEAHMRALQPWLTPSHQLTQAGLLQYGRKQSREYQALETLLKGIEAPLPDGAIFHDGEGYPRRRVRIRWWQAGRRSYRNLALVPRRAEREQLPDTPIPDSIELPVIHGKPVFFGHYWMRGTPAPLTPLAACVDYSVAKGGPLVAYRWDGEAHLQAEHFVRSH